MDPQIGIFSEKINLNNIQSNDFKMAIIKCPRNSEDVTKCQNEDHRK